ncbi:MmgE/PrpD family protein [Streptomyces sp. NPDC004838]
MTGVVERLGAFAAGLEFGRLPSAVVTRAKDCVVHGLVVGAAGRGVGFGEAADAALGDAGGGAHLLGSGRTASPHLAAFANSALMHARAQEDTHGTFHPGVTVIPAALAAAEAEGADGAAFLTAVVAGYEVGTAVSDPLTELTTPPFRATGLYGPLAAAAAAGRVLGLDAPRLASALGLACAFAGGGSETFAAGTDEWHYQSGVAASNGLLAARLAAAGAKGSPLAVEGESGFLDCFVRGRAPRPDGLATGLGDRWRLLDVTFKPYPICAFNQAPALVAARLAAAHGVRPAEVVSVSVRMNEREAAYPGVGSGGPFGEVAQTLMSVRFSVAVALAQGRVDYASLTRFDDPVLRDLVGRIDVVPEPGRPPKTAAATLTLADGRRVESAIEDSSKDLSWDSEAVRDNARRLRPETHFSEEALEALFAAVDALAEARDLGGLLTAALPGR